MCKVVRSGRWVIGVCSAEGVWRTGAGNGVCHSVCAPVRMLGTEVMKCQWLIAQSVLRADLLLMTEAFARLQVVPNEAFEMSRGRPVVVVALKHSINEVSLDFRRCRRVTHTDGGQDVTRCEFVCPPSPIHTRTEEVSSNRIARACEDEYLGIVLREASCLVL